MNWGKIRIYMNQAGGDGGDGGGGSGSQTQGSEGTQTNSSTTEAQGDSAYDEYGYEKTPSESDQEPAVSTEPKAEQKPDSQQNQEEPLTGEVLGYSDKEIEIPADPPPPVVPEEPLKFDHIEGGVDTKALSNGDLIDIKQISETHKLTKEQTQALIDLRAKEVKEFNEFVERKKLDHQKQVALQRQQWTKELKEDKELGGENFIRTLRNVDKVLESIGPGTKKYLTDNKIMLPPIIMRELAKFYENQHSTPKLVRGEPSSKPATNPDDPLDFYK